jgi:putative ABC transport system permease protein
MAQHETPRRHRHGDRRQHRRQQADQDAPKTMTLFSYALGGAAFVGLLLWQARDLKLGAMTAAGFIGGAALFALVAWGCLQGMQTIRGVFDNQAWRFAVTGLQRRPAAAIMQIVALALGLMALLLLTVIRGDLIGAWRQATPADAPNRFVINIQPDQKNAVQQLLDSGAPKRPVSYRQTSCRR